MHHHCSSSITAFAVASIFRFWLWSLCRQGCDRSNIGCQSIVSGSLMHIQIRDVDCTLGYVRPCDLLCIGNGFWCSDLCAQIVLWCWWPSTLKSLRRVPKSIWNEQDSCAGRVHDRMFGNMTINGSKTVGRPCVLCDKAFRGNGVSARRIGIPSVRTVYARSNLG